MSAAEIFEDAPEVPLERPPVARADTVPTGSILTGKQEHYLKRELISRQTKHEITELSRPNALQRFGAPFKSELGEVAPADSELPLLRYIFCNHIRNFPFLDQATEHEFWQDKVQTFLESFARKNISSSEDRLEETKRKKLAYKAEKIVELMMVSGIPTASGYEERIRFSEMEVVDRGAQEQGLVANIPEGNTINGWDINVAGVRMTSFRKTMRSKEHAEFLLRIKEPDQPERFVARRYGDFARLHKQLKLEIPGKVLPPLPRKIKTHGTHFAASSDTDSESLASLSTRVTEEKDKDGSLPTENAHATGFRSYLGLTTHSRNPSVASHGSNGTGHGVRQDGEKTILIREDQRVLLRAFLRNILHNERVAKSASVRDFFSARPITLSSEELADVGKRKEMDHKRVEEGNKFFEIAQRRAAELDKHMERFRRDIVERNGLRNLFKEVRVKKTIQELDPEYRTFCEWLRIEVAAVVYHLFLAEDNAPELFGQLKRIHSLIPYGALRNVIRFANPAAVMKGVLDLFLAQPFGARSLTQRVFALAINDGIRTIGRQISAIADKTGDVEMVDRIRAYAEADEDIKVALRQEAADEGTDLLVVISRTERIQPDPANELIGRVMNAWVAWNATLEGTDTSMHDEAEYFANLKQVLKLCTRKHDKAQMLAMIEEPVTLKLFRDLFTIFYEPLIRVYKSANVYTSVTDFASFLDDAIKVVDAAQREDIAADPNQTVQSFIDLCARHEDDLYKFIHEVHIHDNGLFDQIMGWLENILEFLRHGPKGGKLDMNALYQGAVSSGQLDANKGLTELNALIEWQMARKRWHNQKTRRKMAAQQSGGAPASAGASPFNFANQAGNGLRSSDFGLNDADIQDMGLGDGDDDDEEEQEEREDDEEDTDPLGAERRRRQRVQEALRSRAGEPPKPPIEELPKLMDGFVAMVRNVLAD